MIDTRLMNCGACRHSWTAPATRPDSPVSCPRCEAHICACGCGERLGDMRAHALYKSRACAVALARAGYGTTRAAKANKTRTEVVTQLPSSSSRPGSREPTDAERLRTALRARGEQGIHSHEIRRLGISGNPSQRVADLEALGCEIEHRREFKGRRPGVRYVLTAEPDRQLAEAA